jgi:hypothetical protein
MVTNHQHVLLQLHPLLLQDIASGSVLVRVPLRLAITDVMPEEEQQRVVGQVRWQQLLAAACSCCGPASGVYQCCLLCKHHSSTEPSTGCGVLCSIWGSVDLEEC